MIAIKVDSKNHCNNYSIITLYNKLTELFLQWTFFACGKNWCVMAITRCFGYAYVKTLCTNCEVAQSGLWPRTVICLTARFFSHTFWSPFHPFWTIFLRNNWCVMAVASAWCGSYEYSISWLNRTLNSSLTVLNVSLWPTNPFFWWSDWWRVLLLVYITIANAKVRFSNW